MFKLDVFTNENNVKHNSKQAYILDHIYGMLIIRGFGSGKANVLLNLIREQDNDAVNLLKDLFIC